MKLVETIKDIISETVTKEKLSDLIVAATLFGEAGGEGETGMKAVANVIKNRSISKNQTPKEVVLKPKQFSMWNNLTNKKSQIDYVKSIKERAKKNPADKQAWETAKSLVSTHINQQGDDNTKGAQYYHTLKILPKWASNVEYTTTIGNHKFYKPKKV